MSPKVKAKIENAMLHIASGVTIALIMFFVYGKDADAKDRNKEIDKKADKTELAKLEIELETKVNKVDFTDYKKQQILKEAKEAEMNREFRTWLRDEFKGLREDLKQDIRDIKNNN